MRLLFALLCGLVFGIGLIISGMIDPAKVKNFLDLFGTWDPSLAFVMAGAVAASAPGFWLSSRRIKPFFAEVFQKPANTGVDKQLLSGAAVFGAGWGLGGFCPGPAITALSLAAPGTIVFFVAMLAGMWMAKRARSGGRAATATT